MNYCPDNLFLYELLPDVIRVNDPDGAIKAYMQGIAEMHCYYDEFIMGLTDLFDPWLAPEEYLAVLGQTVGLVVDKAIPESIKRTYIAQAVPTYKVKGTHLSFRILLRSLGLDGAVEELWTDYNLTTFLPTSAIDPVIGGVENPAYNPEVTTDGLVKYKSSFWNLHVYQIAPSIPPSIITILIQKLETIRPLTRTLRKIYFTAEPEPDPFVPPTDEFSGYLVGRTRDVFPGLGCYYYSCDVEPGYYYDGSMGLYDQPNTFFYDYAPITSCELYYNNGEIALYDGLVIADYSGLDDPQSVPFLYDGATYNVTIRYDCGLAKDILDIVPTVSMEDFWPYAGALHYDNDPAQSDPVLYDNALGIFYDGHYGGLLDDISFAITKEFTETISMSDEMTMSVPFDLEPDHFDDTIRYDGEEGYTYGFNDCHTYGESVEDYSNPLGLYYNCESTLCIYYDGASGEIYGINPYSYSCHRHGLLYNNPEAISDEIFITPVAAPEDTVSVTEGLGGVISTEPAGDLMSLPADTLDFLVPISFTDAFSGFSGALYDGLSGALYDDLSGLYYDGGTIHDAAEIVATPSPDPFVLPDDELDMAVPFDLSDSPTVVDGLAELVTETPDYCFSEYLYGDSNVTYGYLVLGPDGFEPFYATYGGFCAPVLDSLQKAIVPVPVDNFPSQSEELILIKHGTGGASWDGPYTWDSAITWDGGTTETIVL